MDKRQPAWWKSFAYFNKIWDSPLEHLPRYVATFLGFVNISFGMAVDIAADKIMQPERRLWGGQVL